MKNWLNYLKKWLGWIILSYIIVIVVFYVFVLLPQKNLIIKYKIEKNLVEYNYFKVKNSPQFLNSIRQTVLLAENKIKNFEWFNSSDDPNFTLFQYLAEKSEKHGLEFVLLERDLKAEKKKKPYYIWKAKFIGHFPQLLEFLYDIETEKKYLRVDEIEIFPGEEGKTFFYLKFIGVKEIKKNE